MPIALAPDEVARVGDDRLVVGGEPRVVAGGEQPLHQAHVVPVDVGLVGERDRRRLQVGALAEPHPRLQRDQVLDVLLGAPEHRLDDDAAMGAEPVEQPRSEEIERALGVVRALHVEPDEAVEGGGPLQNGRHVGHAQLLRDVEAHLRELDRDVDLGAARGHAVEHAEVLIARRHRLGLGADALAQEVERGGDPSPAQLPGRLDPLLDRLARHEPGGESPGEAVPAHEVEHALPLGEPEQALSHDHDHTLWKAEQAAAAARKTAPNLAGRGGGE